MLKCQNQPLSHFHPKRQFVRVCLPLKQSFVFMRDQTFLQWPALAAFFINLYIFLFVILHAVTLISYWSLSTSWSPSSSSSSCLCLGLSVCLHSFSCYLYAQICCSFGVCLLKFFPLVNMMDHSLSSHWLIWWTIVCLPSGQYDGP